MDVLAGNWKTTEEKICGTQTGFKSGVKGGGSDRWWERKW